MSTLNNLQILCINANKSDAKQLRKHLTYQGHKIYLANDEFSVGKSVSNKSFDLILIDNGFLDLTRWQSLKKEVPDVVYTPVIVFADSGQEEAIADAMNNGIDDYIIKSDSGNHFALLEVVFSKLLKNRKIQKSQVDFENALAVSEKKYRTYVENSPIGLFIADSEGKYTDVNDSACKMLGYSREELLSKTVMDIDGSDGYERSKHPFTLIKQTGKFTAEIKLLKKSGERIDCLIHSVMIDENTFLGHCIDITKQKRADQALRESEEKYRTLVENADSSIALINKEGKFQFLNNVAISQLGETAESIKGKSMWDCFPKQFADQQFADIEYVFKTNQGMLTERDTIINGVTHTFRTSIQPVKDSNGHVKSVLVIATNITSRVQAEKALIESEERFRDLAELLPEAIFETDLNIHVTYANRKAFELFGITPEELTDNYSGLNFLAPDDRKLAVKNLSDRIAGNSPGTIEYTAMRKDGSLFPVLFHASSIFRDGKIVGIRGILVDITEQKRTEEKLRKIAEDYEVTSEKTGQMVYDYYPDTGKIRWAGAITSITGYSHEEFQSVCINLWKLMVHPEDRAIVFKKLNEAQSKCSNFDAEYRFKRKDGTYAFIEEHGVFVKNDDGKCFRMLGSLNDISEKKKSEMKLKELEEQFRQAQKMEAIGILAGGVAHDFNNILNVILGYSELLMEEFPKDDPAYKKIENIKSNADRATNLTRQLLAFSRKQILQPSILDLNDVITNIEGMLQRLIDENIEFSTVLDADLHKTKADSGQVEQIIMNLVVNARDAMPEGGKLVVETKNVQIDHEFTQIHSDAVEGDYVMLAISDTGIGMTKEVQSKIFEPFFTTKQPGKGTGLGISTVYGIVKQSGGNIWVYSEPGIGTTFKIFLPASESESESQKIRVSDAKIMKTFSTILVVEDNQSMGEMISEVLEIEGYKVHHISDPADAISYYKEHGKEIDMLLTDVVMPNMSGKQLVDALYEINPELKVLFMSGYTDDAIVKKGVLEEGTQFIQKPFMVKDLVKKIYSILNDPYVEAKI